MAKEQYQRPSQRRVTQSSTKDKLRVHPLLKLLRYRRITSVSFVISFIIAVITYNKSDYFTHDKQIIQNYFDKVTNRLNFNKSIIKIKGNKQLTEQQILQSLKSVLSANIMLCNLNDIKQELEKLPWIHQAVIRRILPQTLIIEIMENEPVAVLQKNKKFFLINERGQRIIETNNRDYNKLIILTGLNAEKHYPQLLKVFNQYSDILSFVKAASYVNQRRWDIFLKIPQNNMLRIQLPEDNSERAFDDLQKVLEDTTVELSKIDTIDVRQPGKVYLKFKNNITQSTSDVVT